MFSRTEEKWIEDNIPHARIYFDMPFALSTAGGDVTTTPADYESSMVEDLELITGQNPRSDHPIAGALIAALDRYRDKRTAT
ncbi:hypothetical protein ACSBOB_07195 [Mesorhizobium sp. ASY16-5R]|uniref:hypothetical protein n=1 Tax=Mesorhizobium sp. ASY16-5R TaxID=3445772 RepID=UPI003F9F35F8